MRKFYQRLAIVVVMTVVSASALLVSPGLTPNAFAGINGSPIEGWVIRFNVKNIDESAKWYEDKLDMKRNRKFDSGSYWTQVYYPEDRTTQIGLSKSDQTGSGKSVATIVVPDIESTRQYLISKGLQLSPIQKPGKNVALSFFKDKDGNTLAIRQNNFFKE